MSFIIVDLGVGNLGSIRHKMLTVGVDAEVSSRPVDVAHAKLLILPGVGHFGRCMDNLTARKLRIPLEEAVVERQTPVLGICLGMQILSKSSEEGGEAGLGWLNAETRILPSEVDGSRFRVPHMGWNTVKPEGTSHLFDGIPMTQRFYFSHSYHVVCSNPEDILATTTYGAEFVSAVRRGNIFGVQFHPEKSHREGMTVIRNFVKGFVRG